MAGKIFRRLGDRPVGPGSLDAAVKERLNPYHDRGNDLPNARMTRRDVPGRIHRHAALVVTTTQRSAEDFREETADRLARRPDLAAPNALGDAAFDVMVRCLLVERPLVTECIMQASAGDPVLSIRSQAVVAW